MDIRTLGRMVGLRQDCRTRCWLDCRTEYSSSCRADVCRSPGKIEIHVLLVEVVDRPQFCTISLSYQIYLQSKSFGDLVSEYAIAGSECFG
jgi:hypothetical protein